MSTFAPRICRRTETKRVALNARDLDARFVLEAERVVLEARALDARAVLKAERGRALLRELVDRIAGPARGRARGEGASQQRLGYMLATDITMDPAAGAHMFEIARAFVE